MKSIILFMGFMALMSCGTNQSQVKTENNVSVAKETNEEKEEWDVYVSDPQYETFLLTAQPKSFWTEETLKMKNQFLVPEWNRRASDPFHYDANFYESQIEYNPNENYGLDFEYKLFMFFKFIEWKYGINLKN